MENIEVKTVDDKIHLVFDPAYRGGRSASGKTVLVASTRGNQSIQTPAGEVTVGLNVYVK